jgi:3',5'-nucleoside bisphosphate phosphatase
VIELHCHTTFSDGLLPPAELVELVRGHGVTELAITDHDTTAAFSEAAPVAERLGVTLIGGIEASVSVGHETAHLLGLGIDPRHERICAMADGCAALRLKRAQAILERLRSIGIRIEWQDVMEQVGAVVTRPHIAAALRDRGFVADIPEAFQRYLADGGPADVRLKSADASVWIDAIHAAGGIAILAHPGNWTSHRTVKALVAMGLDGLETHHPSHDETLVRYYQELADQLGLLSSGGSDFHGRRPVESERIGRYAPTGNRLNALRHRIVTQPVRS